MRFAIHVVKTTREIIGVLMEQDPLHVRVRLEFFKSHPGDPLCAVCKGTGYSVNSAEEYMIEQCDCMSGSVAAKRPFRGEGRTECQHCKTPYFMHMPAPDVQRDWSRCYSVVMLCNGKKVQI